MKLLKKTTPKAPAYNQFLREHVTRVGFNLTLAKTQIAALVELCEVYDSDISQRSDIETRSHFRTGPHRHVFSFWTSGIRACIDRGLVLHHFDEAKSLKGLSVMKDHFTITTAGWAVVTLLKESGLYQEYERSLRLDIVRPA